MPVARKGTIANLRLDAGCFRAALDHAIAFAKGKSNVRRVRRVGSGEASQ